MCEEAEKAHSGQVSSGRTVDGEQFRRRRPTMPDRGTRLEASTCVAKYSCEQKCWAQTKWQGETVCSQHSDRAKQRRSGREKVEC